MSTGKMALEIFHFQMHYTISLAGPVRDAAIADCIEKTGKKAKTERFQFQLKKKTFIFGDFFFE